MHDTTHLTSPAPDTAAVTEGPPGAALGRRRFLAGAGAVTAGVLASGWAPGHASAAPAGTGQFIPLPQAVRVLDTRTPAKYEFTTISPTHRRVAVAGKFGVADDATAIVATLTAVNGPGPNWVTIVPSDTSIHDLLVSNRLVSVLNLVAPGQASANLVHARLGPKGVDIASRLECDVVLDVIGYYQPVSGSVRAGRYVGLPTARRAIDTRHGGGPVSGRTSLDVDVTDLVPAHASAVVINLTATECTGPGFFTAYPGTVTTVPNASNLNVNAGGETRAAAVIVAVSTVAGKRTIKVYAHTTAHVIVDVTGFYTGPTSTRSSDGLFVAESPERILDTRSPGQIGKLWPGWVVEGALPGAAATGAGAVVVNLTGVESRGPGFLTIAPARRALPATSNLNFTGAGEVVPNHAITPITAATGYQVFSSHGAHVIVDYMGYFTGTPASPTVNTPPVNPPPPPIGPEWTLDVPKISLRSRVIAGPGNRIVDQGHSWHWEGTGYLGQDANIASFAHRTTHGGPYRNIHLLGVGDQFTLTTTDGRVYTYAVVRRDLTDGRVANILAATRVHPGTTYSLIACSKTDFTPTSTSWRIVVTGELVGWRPA